MGVRVGAERLFPAWEKIAACPGRKNLMGGSKNFFRRLKEFLPTAQQIG